MDSVASSMSLLPLISYSLSLGRADPAVSPRKGSSIPLVPVTQVCTHQNRAFPQPQALVQGGAISLGSMSFVSWLETGPPLSCWM